MTFRKSVILIVLVLLIDQVSKIYIKTNFFYQEKVEVFSWFYLLFIENDGAAWGTRLTDLIPSLSPRLGKLMLTVFRLMAIGAIGYWLHGIIRKGQNDKLIISVSLIFAGAVGNIIDSMFYGLLFDQSTPQKVATLFTDAPYDGLFYGRVVDMFYFPIIDTVWPDWVPFVGGKPFRFFEAIFNVADASISIGVGIWIVFYRSIFGEITPAAGKAAIQDEADEAGNS